MGPLLSFCAQAASNMPWAQLMAQVGDHQIWTLTLQATAKGCEAVVTGLGGSSSIRLQTLEKSECEELRGLLSQSKKDIQIHVKEQPVFMTDEPLYQLKIAELNSAVAFRAPEICEILSDGNLKCEKVARTSAEKLTLKLRNIASQMKTEAR